MTDKHTLDLAREWVSVDTLRKYISDWREGLATAPRGDYEGEMLDDLEALLPAPPAPESASPRPEDMHELDPAYTYRDKDGEHWAYINRHWRCINYGQDATNYRIPPAKYRPYTRIEDTNNE